MEKDKNIKRIDDNHYQYYTRQESYYLLTLDTIALKELDAIESFSGLLRNMDDAEVGALDICHVFIPPGNECPEKDREGRALYGQRMRVCGGSPPPWAGSLA